MAWGRKRLQKEHPQVWHEVACHTVIGAIEQDFHNSHPIINFYFPSVWLDTEWARDHLSTGRRSLGSRNTYISLLRFLFRDAFASVMALTGAAVRGEVERTLPVFTLPARFKKPRFERRLPLSQYLFRVFFEHLASLLRFLNSPVLLIRAMNLDRSHLTHSVRRSATQRKIRGRQRYGAPQRGTQTSIGKQLGPSFRPAPRDF
jgi:hypothetical protein